MESVTQITNQQTQPDRTSTYAVVKVKESPECFWKEMADIESFSSSGASIHLRRGCKVGTLVSLKIPLPRHLRHYDHDKQLYNIWGLVQHCQPLSSGEGAGFHVGVAFIGRQQPEGYEENPAQNYRIRGMDSDGIWRVEPAISAFKSRKDVRYWAKVELYLEHLNQKREPVAGERTVTLNISRGGAAILTNMDVCVGDKVKFISAEYDFSGLAVVCDRREAKDGSASLHIQFIGSKFPVEAIPQNAFEKKEAN